MGEFFVHIFKASLCIAVLYLFYRLLMNKETFHRFNRVALLCIPILSVATPFFTLPIVQPSSIHEQILIAEALFTKMEESQSMKLMEETEAITSTWPQIILTVYVVGVIFFICYYLYSLARMLLIFKICKRTQLENGIKLYIHNLDIAPFSWMKHIIISEKDMEENSREILIHEMAHIRHRHSLDMLLADICIIVLWFNPATWLIKQELLAIHEYQADDAVIREGVNAKQYQLLLIKKAVGKRLYSMANSFNHSKLKKRITMMSKKKSSPWARLKYLYVLPVVAVSITAFARPEISSELNEISNVKVNDLTAIVKTNNADNQVKGDASSPEKLQDGKKSKVKVSTLEDSIKSKEEQSYRYVTRATPNSEVLELKIYKKDPNIRVSIKMEKIADGNGYKASGYIEDGDGKRLPGKSIKIDDKKITSDSEGKLSFDTSDVEKLINSDQEDKKPFFGKLKIEILE